MNDGMEIVAIQSYVLNNKELVFIDYQPRSIPGFTSDIAEVVGCRWDQTEALLRAADALEDSNHFEVKRLELRAKRVDQEIQPAQIKVIITAA